MDEKFENGENVMVENIASKSNERKEKKGIIVGIVLAIVVIVVGCFLYVKMTYTASSFLNQNSKKINAFVNETFEGITFNKDYLENIDEYDISSDAKLKLTTDATDLKDFNNLEIGLKTESSLKNNYVSLDVNLKQDKASLRGTITVDNNKIYLDSKDLLDKTLTTTSEENLFGSVEDLENTLKSFSSISDLEDALNNLVKYLFEALKEADLSTKYNGLNVVYTYEINDNNKEKIIDKFKSLIKDDEVLSSYLEDDELSLENVKIVVEVSIFGNKIENFTITSEDMEVKGVRTKGNTYEVTSGEEKFNLEVTKEKIVISGNDEYNEPFNLKIEVKDKKIEMNLKSSTTVFNMTLINKKKTSNIKLIIEAEGLKVDGNIDVTTDNKNKKEDLTGKINISYSDYNITLDISSKSEYGKNIINKKDYKDAVDINDITEKDSNTLMTNTMDKISEFKAYKAIEDLLSSFNTSWDDTEDDLLENTCENICPGGKVSDYDFGTCICEDGEEIEV